jgi:hypothetical protein
MNAGRQKVEDEGACRVCGAPAYQCDAAHIWDRGMKGGDFSDPDLICTLCSLFKGGNGCHDKYDARKLNLLPYLKLEEQVAMVKAAGGIERARKRAIGK